MNISKGNFFVSLAGLPWLRLHQRDFSQTTVCLNTCFTGGGKEGECDTGHFSYQKEMVANNSFLRFVGTRKKINTISKTRHSMLYLTIRANGPQLNPLGIYPD